MIGFKNALSYCFISWLIISCGQSPDSSSLRVTNGIDTPDQDLAVVLLRYGQGNLCTGTYISDRVILTAAHCVQTGDEVEVVRMQRSEAGVDFTVLARSLATLAHPDYKRPENVASDLGLIKMPAASSKHWSNIAQRGAAVGDAVRMVGFGHNYINQYTDAYQMVEKGAGEKRSGTNTIATTVDGSLRFKGFISPREAGDKGESVGNKVGIGGGDSGGPLFNQSGELVGVASAQNPEWGEWESIRSMESVFVDLTNPSARDFLQKSAEFAEQ